MAEAVELEVHSNEALLAEGLSDALASEAQVAIAPDVQDVTVADSTTATDSLQTTAPSWREQIGIHAENDAEAIELARRGLTERQQAIQQAQYLAYQNQQLNAQLQAIQQAQQASQPRVEAKLPEPPKVPWELAEYDQSWLSHIDPVTREWKPNAPISAAEGYEKYQKALRQFTNVMLSRPQEAMQPFISQGVSEVVTPLQQKLDAIEARLAQQAQQQELQGFLSPYIGQLYVTDESGKPQRDQFGNPIQTAMGNSFNQFASAIQQSGVTDPKQVALMSLMAAQIADLKGQLSKQPVAVAQPTREQQDAAIYANGKNKTNGATRQPNRGNTINASQGVNAPLQNDRFSAEDLFRQGLREQFPNGIPIG